MERQSDVTQEKVLADLIEQVRPRLLALKKARIVGSKLASIVGQLLPTNTTFRDFLPGDVDRETTPFRVFAERNLSEVVTLSTERRGTDLLYDIVDSGQDIEPEPGSMWQAFVSIKRKQQLVLNRIANSLSAVTPLAAESSEHILIAPVSLSEHKAVSADYIAELKLRGLDIPQLDEILQDYTAASYTKWLKTLRSHQPPLDREWGGFRKRTIFRIFGERLHALGLNEADFAGVLTQFKKDAPRGDDTPAQPIEASLKAQPKESTEEQVRRQLHQVIDRMSLEQMNDLKIPFSLFYIDQTSSD